MRRQPPIKGASTYGLCIFCACSLGVEPSFSQLAPLSSSALRGRRCFTATRQKQESEATQARSTQNGGFGMGKAPWADQSTTPSLSPAEQAEKADRLRRREAQIAEERLLSQQRQLPRMQSQSSTTQATRYTSSNEQEPTHENNRQHRKPMSFPLVEKLRRDLRQRREHNNQDAGHENGLPVNQPGFDAGPSIDLAPNSREKASETKVAYPLSEKLSEPIFQQSLQNQLSPQMSKSSTGWGTGATQTKPLEHGEKRVLDFGASSRGSTLDQKHDQEIRGRPHLSSTQLHAASPAHRTEISGLSVDSHQAPTNGTVTNKANFPSADVTSESLNGSRSILLSPLADLRETGSYSHDQTANWQHLRRRSESPTQTSPGMIESQPTAQPSDTFLDDAWIDRSFEEHRRKRAIFSSPPSQPTNQQADHHPDDANRSFNPRHAGKRCARCGELGHIARECSRPRQSKITCHKCGQPGHLANQCPNRFTNRSSSSKSAAYLSDPYAKGSSSLPFRRSQTSQAQSLNDLQSGSAHSLDTARNPQDVAGQRSGRRGAEESSQVSDVTSARWQTASSRRGQWADTMETSIDEEAKRGGRATRREQWVEDEDDLEARGKDGEQRGQRRARRREFNDDEDEEAFAREEARARKQARQVKKESERKAAKREHEARKAEQSTPITLPEFVSVQNLSQMLGIRYEQFVDRLEDLGYDDLFPGKILNTETSGMIAMEYNFEPVFDVTGREEEERDLKARPEVDDKEFLPARPPVVTIMGHVDHGKTTILDYLRKSSVAAGEAGGITQHIGAFSVPLASSGKTITFLDTPGHAAFLAMRQRGANVTDIVILVVAADDSVKPQTLEALKHAKAAGVPIIVAVNKVDKEEADVQRCKQDLARHGVEIEDYGGDTQVVEVSGKTGKGMDDLEETVVALSEILDHRAETDGNVEGWVLEATTKRAGRVATVLVRRGTLRSGDVIVAGKTWARVKTLRNEAGQPLEAVGPGMPVEVDGWKDQPIAGDEVLQAQNERKATSVVEYRLEKSDRDKAAQDNEVINEARRLEQEKRAKEKAAGTDAQSSDEGTTEELPADAKRSDQAFTQMEVPFVVKADVSGSAEAVSSYILGVSSPLIAPKVLHSGVGAINESDVELASVAQGHIIAFNLRPDPDIMGVAEAKGVKVLENNIIYRVVDDVKAILEDKLPPLISQKVLGEAEVAASFEIGIGGRKKMKIAGCKVRNGVVSRGSRVRVMRKGDKVYDGTIDSLKNVKKDVQEMRKGSDCGMSFENFEVFEIGDQIQTYEEHSERRKL